MRQGFTTTSAFRRMSTIALTMLLVLAACGGDDADDSTAVTTTTAVDTGDAADGAPESGGITIANFSFSPSSLEVAVGDSVEATNDDSVAHTWTADEGAWDSGNLATGDSFTHEFTEAGTFAYHCEIHPSMTGTVTVAG